MVEESDIKYDEVARKLAMVSVPAKHIQKLNSFYLLFMSLGANTITRAYIGLIHP